MPLPVVITDLSTTASLNYPSGSVDPPSALDDTQRAHASFIRQLYDTSQAGSDVFTPAGTGAVATTVQSKLRESVSVKDFGAVGDGVTDDTVAIQAAITRIKTVGGGVVEFPFANYKITSSVSIAGYFGLGGIKIVGNNSKITSTNDSPAFLIDAHNGGSGASADQYRIKAHVDGLYFYGPGKASTNSAGIKIQYSAAVRITDCVMRNYYAGLKGDGVLLSAFEELQINDNAIGISFEYSTTPITFGLNDNHFSRCLIVENDKAMYYRTGGGGNTSFDGCEFESNNPSSVGPADGVKVIDLDRCGKITFNSCYFESNHGQYNIIYSGSDTTGSLNLIGCQFLLNGATGYGVYLDDSIGTANSFTIIGSSVGTTVSGDLYIGTGFSATVINTPINSIYGATKNLQRIAGGKYISGYATSDYAQMLLNGAANPDNIALDVIGLLRFTTAGGATRNGYLAHTGTTLAAIADTGSVTVGTNAGTRIVISRLGTATVEPNGDNTHNLGTASFRWGTVYAGTGTINTSDAREKQQIRTLSDAEYKVALKCKTLIRAFKFNNAVKEKGTKARIHFGVIAQDVKAAFESEGLVAEDYAILCYDEWGDVVGDVPDENEQPTGEKKVTHPAGNRYGVRYEELLAFIISAL